jgi:hypothetical protein
MTGFKSETETGVKSSFSSLAKIAGLAFGGAAIGSLIKNSIESAGQTQAQAVAIQNVYGKAGKAIVNFAETGGTALGGLESSTEGFAVKSGQLFQNLGFGTTQAAKMTEGWTKLGLAINSIRGGGTAGAAQVLDALSLAASGASTRGLNQLGLGISTVRIQAQALKDGLISTIHQALTPAEKATAVYQLATARLPQYLAQAKAASHDFANEQARLSAEWDTAKAKLGTALLPEITKGTTALANWLGQMERSGRLQRDFNQVASIAATVIGRVKAVLASGINIWESFTKAVGGSKNAIFGILGALALLKTRSLGTSVQGDARGISGRIKGQIEQIKTAAKASSQGAQVDFGTMAAKYAQNTKKMSADTKQFGSTVTATTKESTTKVGALNTAFNGFANKTKASAQIAKGQFGAMNQAFSDFATHAEKQSSGFSGAVRSASSRAASAFGSAATSMKIAAIEVGATIKVALIQTGIGLLVVAIGIAVGYVITHWDTIKKYTIALAEAVIATWRGLKTTLIGIAETLGGALATYLTYPLRGFLEVASKVTGWLSFLPGVSGLHDKVNEALDFLKKGTTDLVTKGASNVAHGVTSIFNDAKKAWQKSLASGTTDSKAKADATTSGKKWGKTFGDGATTAITQAIPAMSKTISDALQNTIQAAHKAILDSVRAAKDNLDKIGGDLAKSIDTIQQKLGGAAGSIAGSPQGAAFLKLKKLIEGGAPGFEIGRAATELQNQLQNVGKTQKTTVQSQIGNLTAAFDKGKISFREFESRLHKILHEDGITMGQALKAGGPAFADAVKAQIAALRSQAKAIADVPAKFRGVGGAGGAADIKIIRPLETIKLEQEKVRVAMAKAASEAQKQRAAQLKQAQKQTAFQQQMATVGVKVIPTPAGRTRQGGQHHTTGQVLGQIRDHARRTADALTKRHPAPVVRPTFTRSGAGAPTVRPVVHRPTASPRGVPVPRRPVVHVASPTSVRSFTDGFSRVKDAVMASRGDIVRGLKEVCNDIAQADKDIVAAELHVTGPMENLRRTELRIADNAAKQRSQQITLQRRTNSLLTRLHKSQNARLPGYGKTPPGKGSHNARKANHAGVRA